jgi:DNA topoisomerase IA
VYSDTSTSKRSNQNHVRATSTIILRLLPLVNVLAQHDYHSISTDWVLELGVLKRGRILRATWEAGRSFSKAKTESLIEKALNAHATAIVSSVVIQEKKQGRPIPLNTVALLKACSKALGIGPHAAMQTAERLYLR